MVDHIVAQATLRSNQNWLSVAETYDRTASFLASEFELEPDPLKKSILQYQYQIARQEAAKCRNNVLNHGDKNE
jgi:hypothetical protein